MAKRIPRRFRKELSEKRFQKRILGRVHLPKEQSFLEELYERTDRGTRVLPSELSKEERTHLLRLARDIRKNRGSLRTLRVGMVGLLLAGPAVFSLFFLDSLLARGLESGLEAVFQARAEVSGLDFSLRDGAVDIDAIRVGDRRAPRKNLFEISDMRSRVQLNELLRGNIVISRATLGLLETGTSRETSAVPADPEEGRTGESAEENGSGAGAAELADRVRTAGAEAFAEVQALSDPAALLAAERENLQTPVVIDELTGEYRSYLQAWEGRYAALDGQVRDVLASTQDVLAIDPRQIDTAGEVRDAVATLAAGKGRVEVLLATVELSAGTAQRQLQSIGSDYGRVEAAIEADRAYIASRVDFEEMDVSGFTRTLAEGFLTALLGPVYTSGTRVLEIGTRLRETLQERGEEDQGAVSRAPGRTLRFGAREYPRFYLKRAAMTVQPAGRDLLLSGELLAVSSDPALTGGDTELLLSGTAEGRGLELQSTLSYEGSQVDSFTTELAGEGFSFRAPTIPGIGSMSSAYSFNTVTSLAESRASSAARVELANLDLDAEATENIVLASVQDVMAGLGRVAVDGAFSVRNGRLQADRIATTADEAIRAGVRQTLRDRRDEYVDLAGAALEDYLNVELGELERVRDEATGVLDDVQALREQLENRDQLIAEQRARLEERGQAFLEEQRQRAEAEARRAAEEARTRAEEEARRAAEEAEQRARERAGDIDLPDLGF